MATFAERMQAIWRQYVDAGGSVPASTHEVAEWAVQNRLWQPRPSAVVDICAEELARALREEYHRDPQGRSVRTKHVARVRRGGRQLYLWDDIRTASRSHMEIALKQRRRQIVGDCQQLKSDCDSYNDNHEGMKPIALTFDFTRDLIDHKRAG